MDRRMCFVCGGALEKLFCPNEPVWCPKHGALPVTWGVYQQVTEPLGEAVLEELRRHGLGYPWSPQIEQIDIERYLK